MTTTKTGLTRRRAAGMLTALAATTGLIAVGMPGAHAAGAGQLNAYTPGIVHFTVPEGVTSLDITAYGAQGGSGLPGSGVAALNQYGVGGRGAKVTGTVEVTPGETLTLTVGNTGGMTGVGYRDGGFGGGGDGQQAAYEGLGGGGASSVYDGDRPLLVAGGGGGAAWGHVDGGASGAIGGSGSAGIDGRGGEPGRTGGQGGAGGDDDDLTCSRPDRGAYGLDGSAGQGGSGITQLDGYEFVGGGGGGGGYVGGGAGGGGAYCHNATGGELGIGGGGGGGSSYVAPGSADATTHEGVQTGAGAIFVSYER